MKKYVVNIGLLGLGILLFSACQSDSIEKKYPAKAQAGCDTIAATFAGEVRPIFVAKCGFTGCHDGSSQFNILDYNRARQYGNLIVERMTLPTSNSRFMPQFGTTPNSEREIRIIRAWICKGFPQ